MKENNFKLDTCFHIKIENALEEKKNGKIGVVLLNKLQMVDISLLDIYQTLKVDKKKTNDVWLIKTDNFSGDEEWNQLSFGGTHKVMILVTSVQQTMDGGYIITMRVDTILAVV